MPDCFELEIDRTRNETAQPRHFLKRGFVVSKKFIAALRLAGVDNFETWPAILIDPKTSEKWEDYCVFNEIGVVDAALLEASEFSVLMAGGVTVPPLLDMKKLVFDREKVKNKKMFRIPQFSADLFISDKVMDVLCENAPPDRWGISADAIDVHYQE
jgi:hypothetical protein